MDDREVLLKLLETDISEDVRNAILSELLNATGVRIKKSPVTRPISTTSFDSITGQASRVTGRDYLISGGSVRQIARVLAGVQEEADGRERKAKETREYCGKLEALYDEVKEIIDLHKLVETDYEEIIADLYLRNGTEE